MDRISKIYKKEIKGKASFIDKNQQETTFIKKR